MGSPDAEAGILARSFDAATGNAGNLTITVDKLLSIVGRGLISTETKSGGMGGDVTIHTRSLSIDGSATMPGLFRNTGITADTYGNGDAGKLTITVDKLLSIVSAGIISARTFSNGNGGNLTIHAGSLSIDGSVRPGETGIFVLSDATNSKDATGDAGNLRLTVDRALSIVGGGSISANTQTRGKGGGLTIHAGSLSIDGSAAPENFTGIEADSSEGATGDAGNVTIRVDGALSVVGSGGITAPTFSSGNGGNLTIHAGSLSIDGSATPDHGTGIFVISGSDDPSADHNTTGDAGNLTITVDKLLSIVGGGAGKISATTSCRGKGGSISIHAGSLSIDGSASPSFATGIFADSDEFATGDAGNLTIRVDKLLSIVGSGQISARTFSSGNGGDVTLHAGSLSIDGSEPTGISSESHGSGDAGSVHIGTVGPVKLKHGAAISTLSETTDAGLIKIISGGKIKLKDQSSITVSAGRNGGDIRITAPELVYLLDSSIKATAGTQRTNTGVGGTGGNITIDPTFIVLNNSLISANAAIGQGGNINLVSDFFFNSDLANNNITATGTTNGTVNITAPALDLGAQLITLPSSLLSAESQLQERCAALLRGDFSSFISVGRGGTEPAPEELQTTF